MQKAPSSLTKLPLGPLNIQKWLDEQGEQLGPPVSAGLLHRAEEFFVMIVKGPNQRSDFHINPGNEWFFQLQGQLILNLIDVDTTSEGPTNCSNSRHIVINEGEAFMLPSAIPHSPIRASGTIGLVLERIRKQNELDALCWFCEICKELVHKVTVYCPDHQLGAKFAPLIQSYYTDETLRTCRNCNHLNSIPSSTDDS